MKKSLFLAVFLIFFAVVSMAQAAQYFSDIPVISIKNTVSADGGGGGGGGGTTQSGTISGKITDENGAPILSAYVYAYHWNGQYCDTGYYSSVDSEGNYSISPPPGEYVVAAYSWDSYYGEIYPDYYGNNCDSNAPKVTVAECNETCTAALCNFSLVEKPITTNIWINSGQEIPNTGGEVGYSVSLTNNTGERKRVVVTVTLMGQSAAPTTLTTWSNSQILRKELILIPNTTLSLNDLKLTVPAGAAMGYYSLKLAVGYSGSSIWQTLSESWNGFQKL